MEGLEPTAVEVAPPDSLEYNARRNVLVVTKFATKYWGVGSGLWVKYFSKLISITEVFPPIFHN